ncbi:MAG: response regulator [Chloroflexota bacterium]|nr:response regulator [Chloroflexota bacterium]
MTSLPDDAELFEAIRSGATAYISKQATGEEIIALMRRVREGDFPLNENLISNPRVAERVLMEFRNLAHNQHLPGLTAPLSPREMEVLDLIRDGCMNKEIANHLCLTEQTIKNHVTSILRKLDVNDRTQAVLTAVRQGWMTLERQESGQSSREKTKFLVIDDHQNIIDTVSLCIKLRWPTAKVVAASDGVSGLQMVEKESPDVVILDLGLPDLDGLEVLHRVRRFSQVPVIILTVRDQDSDIARALHMGADDYITKPFSHTEFLARVEAVLRRSGGSSNAEARPLRGGELGGNLRVPGPDGQGVTPQPGVN